MSQFYFKRKTARTISLGNGFEAYPLPIKCVIVGDCKVGKTSIIKSYTNGSHSSQYCPTIFDTYKKELVCEGVVIDLEICDTTGQENLERIRSLTYLETDIFVVCFSTVSPQSLHNVLEKWIPEIKHYRPNKPIILVGTKSDLRDNTEVVKELLKTNESPIGRDEGQKFAAKYGISEYQECSAETQFGVKQIFDVCLRKVLELHLVHNQRNSCVIS